MTLKDSLLLELENNLENGVCGQDFAEKYSVSRNAVWKTVQSLRKDGYEIGGATNRGYRLLKSIDKVTPDGIRKYLPTNTQVSDIICFDTIDSTNAYALNLAEQNAKNGTLVIAENQTCGRGRIGRTFFSPKGGIYMTIIVRPCAKISDCAIITPMAAVAVAQAMEKVSGKPIDIKWVNDIYYKGKKLCGIMSQAVYDFENAKIGAVVIGIGINFCQLQSGFPQELSDKAGALFEGDAPVSRNCLIAEICARLLEMTQDLTDRTFLEEYKKRSVVLGRNIKFIYNNVEKFGTAKSIDFDGGLVLDTSDGEMKLTCGEVSILPKSPNDKWI